MLEGRSSTQDPGQLRRPGVGHGRTHTEVLRHRSEAGKGATAAPSLAAALRRAVATTHQPSPSPLVHLLALTRPIQHVQLCQEAGDKASQRRSFVAATVRGGGELTISTPLPRPASDRNTSERAPRSSSRSMHSTRRGRTPSTSFSLREGPYPSASDRCSSPG
jgi:hypothetical protein